MPSPLTRRTLAFAACLLSAAAAGGTQTGVTSVAAPGGAEAGMYSLAPEGDGAVLGWLEPSAGGRAFRFSFYRGGRWSTPQTIAEGPDLFANWADHPSIVSTGDGSLVAQWPVVNPGKPAPGSYNNSIRIATSRDRGRTWTTVFADGTDNIHSYSGFVSLLLEPSGFSAVYLTPPRPVSRDPADHSMT